MIKTLFFLFFSLFIASVSCFSVNVIELTNDNFKDIVNGKKDVFVKFFAPWCGHCKNLAPVWDQLADSFAYASDSVVIAKLNADHYRELGGKFEVEGYPTLLFFPRGDSTLKKFDKYQRGRDLGALTAYVTEKTGLQPRVQAEKTDIVELDAKNFEKIVMDKSKNVLVEFTMLNNPLEKAFRKVYAKLATNFLNEPDCVIASLNAAVSPQINNKFFVSQFPSLKFFPKDQKEPVDYTNDKNEDALTDFLNEHCGTFRKSGGGLNELAGIDEELDGIVHKFITETDSRQDLLTEAKTVAKSKGTKAAEYYAKVMEKMLENEAYPSTELNRLNAILSKGKTAAEKKDFFEIRQNILKVFLKPRLSDEL